MHRAGLGSGAEPHSHGFLLAELAREHSIGEVQRITTFAKCYRSNREGVRLSQELSLGVSAPAVAHTGNVSFVSTAAPGIIQHPAARQHVFRDTITERHAFGSKASSLQTVSSNQAAAAAHAAAMQMLRIPPRRP